MAAFDDALNQQNAQLPIPIPDPNRMAFLEGQFQYLFAEVTNLRGMVNNPPPPPPQPSRPNLNLPLPLKFSGTPSEFPTFKVQLFQFLMGNRNTYQDSETQLLLAGSLLAGSAFHLYLSLIDPVTIRLPQSYTIDSFIQELEDFFGGGDTLQSRERSLDVLRQTGSVSELAISFQNITSTFIPRWSDHPLICIFSIKLKEVIRFELTARGSIPVTFQAYVALAIMVEQNQAAAASSRSQGSSNPPPRTPPVPSNRPPPPPPSSGPAPMDVDGTRTRHGSLTSEERRRRSDAGLCAYCGGVGHQLATCPRAAHIRQARGTFPHLPALPAPPAGYPYPPGFPYPQGPFLGP